MRAVTWHGLRDVRVSEVPDPVVKEPTDAIIRVTSAAICGSDLHLYEVFKPFMDEGDILGHEAMGIVEEVGPGVGRLTVGDRVVVPANIACGHCYMCERMLFAQCETTQVREHGSGAKLFGYTRLYGSVPGGQAEYLRVPHAHFGPIAVGSDLPDERYLFLSDVLPTAYQGVQFAAVPPEGGTVLVIGLGPIGQMAARIARLQGARVMAVEVEAPRRAMAERHGIETMPWSSIDEVADEVRSRTDGRGADSVIECVGMEARGSPVAAMTQRAAMMLPDAVAAPLFKRAGVDRLAALMTAIEAVRRRGTISILGVYGGMANPLPMLRLFDKGVQLRMGQVHVRRWTEALLPLVEDDSDPLGLSDFVTHKAPLAEAPAAYEMFQKKEDGAVKVMLQP